MKKMFSGAIFAFVGVSVLFSIFSCDGFRFTDKEKVSIRLSFYQNDNILTKGELSELPDTNSFILDIRSEEGEVVYSGLYGNKPQELEVVAGIYTIKVSSSTVAMPKFSLPVYGDSQTIKVDKDDISVRLICKQTNAGIKINFSENYAAMYRHGRNILRSGQEELEYGLDEDRIAFFSAGDISLIYAKEPDEVTLLKRNVASGEILTLSIDCLYEEDGPTGGVSIKIDSTRVWRYEDLFLGRDRNGSSVERAFSVGDIKEKIGMEEVWICGYIVGGDLSQKDVKTIPPFESKTNLAIADYRAETSRENMISVELSLTKVKAALNLVDNADLFRTKIYVKGNIVESYFGLNGVKSVREYHIETD